MRSRLNRGSAWLGALMASSLWFCLPAGAQTTVEAGVDGLLGMSFLSHFKVSIDLRPQGEMS
jgi:hypothetical protein